MLQRICSLIALSLALAALGTPATRTVLAAPADAIFTVDSTLDEPDANVNDAVCSSTPSGKCTLRAAVMQANVVIVDTTIQVPAGVYTLTLAPVLQDGPETGDLNLTTPTSTNPVISIVGTGADSTIIDGYGTDRVFFIATGRTARISGVTIRNGRVSSYGSGGGIGNSGTLTLNNSTLSGNSAFGGGGIFNTSTATLNNSTLNGNSALLGGGIDNASTATLNLNNSTLSFNPASGPGGEGGGINNSGTATLTNSTLSGNPATQQGGGSTTAARRH